MKNVRLLSTAYHKLLFSFQTITNWWKDKVLPFFKDTLPSWCKDTALPWGKDTALPWVKDNLILSCCIGGAVLLLLILAIVCGAKKRKKKKLAKAAAKAEKKAAKEAAKQTPVAPAPVSAAPAKETATAQTEPVSAAPAKAPVEEAAPLEAAPKEAAVVEKAAPVEAPVEAAVVEEEPEEAAVVEKAAPVETPEEASKATDVEETLALAEQLAEGEPEEEEEEVDQAGRYSGKWTICRVLTDAKDSEEMYFFELRASNGEKLLSSEEYTTYSGALRGIQTHKTNILGGNLKMTVSKKGDYIFKLLSGKNMLLCMGENYPTKERCQRAIDSTVRFAATAILDENVQDVVVKVPKEEDTPLPPPAQGSVGKWIVSATQSADGEKVFYFELFANNGERLLTSKEYTTYIGAVNGIHTHKNNIQKDNFRITLTKRGDYIYKLLNGNGQLLCLGEHYKTKRLCQSAVDSVKRFALGSSIYTDVEQK